MLAFLNALRGAARFLLATLIIVVLAGGWCGCWGAAATIWAPASWCSGTSGCCWPAAWHDRRPASLLTAGLALLLYGGALWGVLPSSGRISWESHLFGFGAGLLAAHWLPTGPKPESKKRPRRLA